MSTRGIALAWLATLLAAPRAFAAGSALLGAFAPIAVEEGGRAAWICPAALGWSGSSQLLFEGVFPEDPIDGFGELSAFTFAAATSGRAYAFQVESGPDRDGVADWIATAAHSAGRPHGPRLGTAVEYRGGEDSGFDGVIGVFLPVGRTLRGAASVENVLEKDIDNVETQRTWRGGAAARGRLGWLSWDWLGQEQERARHFFGAGLDARWLRLSGALDDDGGWTAEVRLVVGESAGGAGMTRPEQGADTRFASLELGSSERRIR